MLVVLCCLHLQVAGMNYLAGQGEAVALVSATFKCRPGSISVISFSSISGFACSPCPQGKFNPTGGGKICFACAAGRFQNNTAQAACAACPQGYFQQGEGKRSCRKCGKCGGGERVEDCHESVGPGVCRPCPKGMFSLPESFNCLSVCPADSYRIPGPGACRACPPGQHQPLQGNIFCVQGAPTHAPTPSPLCLRGRFMSNVHGLAECVRCPSGKFQRDRGSPSCNLCSPGQYQHRYAKQSCLRCNVGEYQPLPGQSQCKVRVIKQARLTHLCNKGLYSTSNSSACIKCPSGKYQDQAAQITCKVCAKNKYQHRYAQINCQKCPKGKHQSAVGSSMCAKGKAVIVQRREDCAAGRFYNESAVVLNGLHQTLVRAVCSDCSPGLYQGHPGHLTCIACPVGLYQAKAGQAACPICNRTKYLLIKQPPASTCCSDCDKDQVCEPGKYLVRKKIVKWDKLARSYANAVSNACYLCPAGKFTSSAKQPRCTDCHPGRYQRFYGRGYCRRCALGMFSESGSKNCTLSRKTLYQRCTEGRYRSSINGVTKCVFCAKGKFQPFWKQNNLGCFSCPTGKHSAMHGKTSCTLCAAGLYRGVESTQSTSCLLCNAGYYANGTGNLGCVLCPPGTSQHQQGQRRCELCAAGKFVAVLGQAVCTECSSGQVQKVEGGTSCSACAPWELPDADRAGTCLYSII
jgi:hypothetical protein